MLKQQRARHKRSGARPLTVTAKCYVNGQSDRRRAGRLADSGRLIAAIGLYRRAARACWHESDVLYDLSITLRELGRDALALRYLASAQRLNPFDPEIAYERAHILDDIGKDELAQESYQRAVSLDPKFAAAWNNLGLIHLGSRQYERAETAFRRALRIEPKRRGTALNIALSLLGQGRDMAAASAAFAGTRLLNSVPDRRLSRDDRTTQASLMLIAGQQSAAHSLFASLGVLSGRDLWGVLIAADALHSAGLLSESGAIWEFALSLKPDMADAIEARLAAAASVNEGGSE